MKGAAHTFYHTRYPLLKGLIVHKDQQTFIPCFKRINSMELKSKLLIGFGISNNKTFLDATRNSRGAIIGSAFIKFLKNNNKENIVEFINSIRGKSSSKN